MGAVVVTVRWLLSSGVGSMLASGGGGLRFRGSRAASDEGADCAHPMVNKNRPSRRSQTHFRSKNTLGHDNSHSRPR